MNLSPLPLAVFVVDATGAITSWNRACEKLAGYDAAAIRNRRLDAIIAFDDASAALTVRERVNEDSTGELICADGHRVPGKGSDAKAKQVVDQVLGPQNHDIDAPEVIWEFFKRFAR